MSTELERRLARAFTSPSASLEVEQRARRAALASIPRAERRDPARLLVAVAAACAALAIGAAALAASGEIHVHLGPAAKPAIPPPRRLDFPPSGSRGLAVVAGGRLWLVTAAGRGARLEQFAASAAGLSPRALYVAVGSGRSLVAISPSGRSAWVQQTRGVVRSIAWAPDGIEIAYVVALPGRGNELHMIEGNGVDDRLLAAHVAPVTPSWRADSLALAFVDGRGRATVDDLGRGTIRAAAPQRACAGRASAVAFAPRGRSLAFVAGPVLGAVTTDGRPSCLRLAAPASFAGLAWAGSQLLVTGGRDGKSSSVLQSWRVGGSLRKLAAGSWAARLLGVVSREGGGQPMVFGLPPAGGVQWVQLGLLHGDPALRGGRLSVRAFWQVSAGAPAHVSWR